MTITQRVRRRAPRWVILLLGLACFVVGATLVTRPFASLSVLVLLVAIGLILHGVADLLARDEAADRRMATGIGVAWIVAGIAVLVWPGTTLRTLSLVVGAALIVGGGSRLLGTIRGDVDQRIAAALLGGAGVVAGLLTLGWPDLTTLILGALFGLWLVVFGLQRLWEGIRWPDPASAAPAGPEGRIRRFARTASAAVALLVALALGSLSLSIHAGEPTLDAFYEAPADAATEPGVLLRSESFARAVPDGAQAWRILYTTSRQDGTPAVASGLVVASTAPADGPRPVIAWAHGTTGVAEVCAPSAAGDPFTAGATPALPQIVDSGWALVATDYIGLGTEGPHGYLVGEEAARAVLDAARAARQMPELELRDDTVVWGHSQGGGVALWTGIIAPDYAPDVNVIGVAALSPASDLPGLVGNLDVLPGGALFASYVIQGYSDTYDDVRFDDYVRPTARIVTREMAARCLAEPEVFTSIIESFVIDKTIWSSDPGSGPLGARLAENVPSRPIPAPLLVGQGSIDPLVLPTAQAAYVDSRCAAGYQVDYRTYDGFEHVDVVGSESPLIPDLLAWTQARLDGEAPISTCP